MSTSTDVLSTVDGSAAVLRLNRPDQLNAFTIETVEALRAAAGTAADDPEIHGIVITGNGRAFTAGLDTGDLTRSTEGTLASIERPEPR